MPLRVLAKQEGAFSFLLKNWRQKRRLSQLDLALSSGVSQRHVSFLESGRAKPSRSMILQLSEALDVPLRELNDWLTHKVRPMFERRVLPVSEDIMFKWRLLVEEGRRIRHTFSQPDLIIAATALHHGMTLVSRNTSDFEKARVPIFNPWG